MNRSTEPGTAISHYPALDGLRGVAILLVLLLHFGVGADFRSHVGGGWAAALERLFYVGWVGVDLFFVLSGFLISSILLTSRNEPAYFRTFYGRRALRILPLYYFVLVLAFVVAPHTPLPEAHTGTTGQLYWWTYTVNIAVALNWPLPQVGSLVAHFWSLAIEEQYYFVWPAIVRRAPDRMLFTISVGLIVCAGLLRVSLVYVAHQTAHMAYYFSLTRLDGFGVGGLIALALCTGRQAALARWAHAAAAPLFGALAAMFFAIDPFYISDRLVVTGGHTLLALFFGCLTVFAIERRPPWLLTLAPLRLLGRYAYGLYVWHWPVQQLLLTRGGRLATLGEWYSATFLACGLLASLVLAVGSYHLLERPFLRLKNWFPYAQSTRAGSARATPTRSEIAWKPVGGSSGPFGPSD
jgi:peptidoglycan/LPS O-acetylase OafA/YrhL